MNKYLEERSFSLKEILQSYQFENKIISFDIEFEDLSLSRETNDLTRFDSNAMKEQENKFTKEQKKEIYKEKKDQPISKNWLIHEGQNKWEHERERIERLSRRNTCKPALVEKRNPKR